MFCDKFFKDVDTSDYWICTEDFSCLERKLGLFKVDYFASSRSKKIQPFFSRFGCREAEGFEAFSADLKKGVY